MFKKKFDTLKLRIKCSECGGKNFKNVGIIVKCMNPDCNYIWDGLSDWQEQINYEKNRNTPTRNLIR